MAMLMECMQSRKKGLRRQENSTPDITAERIAIIQKKKVNLGSYRSTDQLLNNLAESLNVKTMGFFMADDSLPLQK